MFKFNLNSPNGTETKLKAVRNYKPSPMQQRQNRFWIQTA